MTYYTTTEFIEKAKKVHGDKYDYSSTFYHGVHDKIRIKCPIHGNFKQTPSHHLKGHGCKKCGGLRAWAKVLTNKI